MQLWELLEGTHRRNLHIRDRDGARTMHGVSLNTHHTQVVSMCVHACVCMCVCVHAHLPIIGWTGSCDQMRISKVLQERGELPQRRAGLGK